ncbi:MAG TPA: methionyl-tRNA formyltransferase [Syntrophomonas sp.]|nr:methionyl-tRNA formyltransferase [Syntrophomonas sp.]HCF71684.1 methionyl-tRNA formyltransferase [Syntrophomonas sp.]
MRLVFMGTSEFAVPALQGLIKNGNTVLAAVTKPDRPRGRGGRTYPTPVKDIALNNGIPVVETKKIREPESIKQVEELNPDLIVVVSFGQIIPSELLYFPKFGCINLHPSLLPLYRGPAPMQRALMAGETKTGVTTMFLDEGLDTGDIIFQREISIPENCDYGELEQVLSQAGAELMVETVDAIAGQQVSRRVQENEKATYAPLITIEDEKIDWSWPAARIHNQIRGLSPFPGAYAALANTRFKIYRTRVIKDKVKGEPGEIKEITKDGMSIVTGAGVLEILEVQREGKKRMSCSNFIQGIRIKAGDRLD